DLAPGPGPRRPRAGSRRAAPPRCAPARSTGGAARPAAATTAPAWAGAGRARTTAPRPRGARSDARGRRPGCPPRAGRRGSGWPVTPARAGACPPPRPRRAPHAGSSPRPRPWAYRAAPSRSGWGVLRHAADPARRRARPPGRIYAMSTELPDVSALSIGILGGTGDQGKGLARRFALAGHTVLIGSRSAERAEAAARELDVAVRGAENAVVAAEADVVIVAVPWEGHKATLEALREPLAGKIVIDCVNPIGFDAKGAYPLPVEEGSAAQQAQALLPESKV